MSNGEMRDFIYILNLSSNSDQRPLRSSTSYSEIISKLPQSTAPMHPKTFKAFVDSLERGEFITKEDIQHPKIQSLLNKTKEIIPRMSVHELSGTAVGIMKHMALHQDEINGKVRDALIPKLRELPFRGMLFLDFIIYKSKSTVFYKTVQLKI